MAGLVRDGSAVVFTVGGIDPAGDEVYAAAVSLRTRAWGRLMDGAAGVRAPLPGYLLAHRGPDLAGVAFDARGLTVTGLPVPVAPAVAVGVGPAFAMSAAGTLVTGVPGASDIDVALEWHRELRRLVPAPQPALPR